jgi:hypothetical protein
MDEPLARALPKDLDPGIEPYVHALIRAGVHTFESCDGSEGHTYRVPTVRFYGNTAEGWRALAICKDHGFPVAQLQRTWAMEDGEPSGPFWQIVFRGGA